MEVPFPPPVEQRRIVAKLDALTARLARARAELDHVEILSEAFRREILKSAFRGRLTPAFHGAGGNGGAKPTSIEIDGRTSALHRIPDAWRWVSASEMASISGGLTKNQKRGLLPVLTSYLRVANVYANELRLDDIADIGCTESEFRKTKLEKGDLLVVEGNGSLDQVGRVAIWDDQIPNCSHQNHLIRVRSHSGIVPKFLLFWLLSPDGRIHLERLASSSSGLHTLSISKIAGLPVPLPLELEQHAIVSRIEAAFARADRLEAETAHARALLGRLETTLLSKAFRGELVPQDPNDEPASMLLDRIRATSSAQPKATHRGTPQAPSVTRAPRKKAAMTKSRSDDTVKNKPYLAGLLRAAGGKASAETLFKEAELPIADFYKQLAWEVDAGHIKDNAQVLEAT